MPKFTGGPDGDSFVGGPDADQATGGDGDDILVGLGGNDRLDGGAGDDSLDGGTDSDILIGGTGRDDLIGGAGSDQLFSDAIDPNFGGWIAFAGESFDKTGEPDTLDGGAGDDYLFAGFGDSIDGGTQDSYGDRLFISFMGSPTGVNADFRPLASNPNQTLVIAGTTISHIESVDFLEGTQFDDTLASIQGSYTNPYASVYGRGGNDLIIGNYYSGFGSGGLYGGDGNDTIDLSPSGYGGNAYGEAGDDTILGGNGFGRFDGGDGNDTITMHSYGSTAFGGSGDDVIVDGDGSNSLNGDDGADRITGGGDRDIIDGGAGDDLIYGDIGPGGVSGAYFAGNDAISGGAGADTIYGDDGDDAINGGSEDDSLYGGAGNDSITAGSGADMLDGGAGDDTLYGNEGDDLLRSGSGVDQLSGEIGDDRLYFGAWFGSGDLAAGSGGNDSLVLQGDYASGATLAGTTVIGVETLRPLSAADPSYGGGASGASFSYRLTFADNLIPSGSTFMVDAAGLAAGEGLTLNASAETNGNLTVAAGAGNDDLVGGAGTDFFYLQTGGSDHAAGGAGNDGFFFGAAFTGADLVDGGSGKDSVALQGEYGAGIDLSAVSNVEFIALFSGSDASFGDAANHRYDYSLTAADTNVAAGGTMTLIATGLLAGEDLAFNGAAETDGGFAIFAGQGNDSLTGGAGSDGFFFGTDGNLTAVDRVDGGGGIDSLALRGNYSVTLQDATFRNVEVLALLSGHTNEYGGALVAGGFDYDVTLANGNVAAGQALDVIATTLGADESVRVDGRAESDGAFRILAGSGDDNLYGGSGNDTLSGGLGADRMEGGAGADTYVYRSAAESSGIHYDTITGFDWHADKIDIPGSTARAFGQTVQDSLSSASFDTDLAAGLAGHLGAGEAAIFTANGGTLNGHVFAVIDLNGQAGYQSGADLVIELVGATLPIDIQAGIIF